MLSRRIAGFLRSARQASSFTKIRGVQRRWSTNEGLSASQQTAPQALSQNEKLPVWAGGDREALVYASLERFEPVDIIDVSGRVFNAPVRTDLVHNVVHWQRAKRRAGTAKTKTRGEVAGSTRKMRPQKGSGRSRVGDRRTPIWRGGGVVHGPTGKKIWDYPLPMNTRRQGLRSALTSKFANGKVWIVENVELSAPKTALVCNAMDRLHWKSALVIDHCEGEPGEVDPDFRRASHNLREVVAMAVKGINVYDVLYFQMLVMTKPALQKLEERFARYDWFV